MKKLYLVRATEDLGKPVDVFDFQTAYMTRAEAEEHLPTKELPAMDGRDYSIEELDAWWIQDPA
jgi:hypothetical protein